MTARRALLAPLALAVALAPALMSCAGDDGPSSPDSTPASGAPAPSTGAPQPLTLQQAELLASMRLANYRQGSARFTTTVEAADRVLDLHGVVDWTRHLGTAVFRSAGRTDEGSHGLMQWNGGTVAAHAGGDVDGDPPAPPDDGGWVARDIDATSSALDAVFLVMLNLGNSQPDNPQLLQQTDARYLGTEIVAGRETSVFTGPSADVAADPAATAPTAAPGVVPGTTYWVAADGLLVRFAARVGTQVVTIDLSAPPDGPVEYLPELVAG